MELATYLAVTALAVVLGLKRTPLPRLVFTVLAATLFAAVSLVVRLSGFDADIPTYAATMHSESWTTYLLREPVIWLGQRYLFALLKNEILVFVVFDLIGYAFVAAAFRRLLVPQYAYLSFIVFFPFMMGMQNVYRQWFAGCVLLYALSVLDRHTLRGGLLFIVAVATHNAAAIFAGLLGAHAQRPWRNITTPVSFVVAPIAIYFGRATKSSMETGLRLELAYILLLSLLFVFLLEKLQ